MGTQKLTLQSDERKLSSLSNARKHNELEPVSLKNWNHDIKRGRGIMEEDLSDNDYDGHSNTDDSKSVSINIIDLDHDFDATVEEKLEELTKVQLTDDELDDAENVAIERGDIVSEEDTKLMKLYRVSQSCKIPELKRRKIGQFTSCEDEIAKCVNSLKIRKRYMERYNIQPPMFLQELESRISKHLPICKSILSGKVSSLYYTQAKKVQNDSSRDILTTEELRSLNMHEFIAGYFGLRRQGIVGMLILEEFGDCLATNKNPVVKFWGPSDFSHYVLAPELLCYLCMEDLHLEHLEDAWDLMQSTTEFGTVVADNDPLEPFEVEIEQKLLKKLNLGAEYFSMNYRKQPFGSQSEWDQSSA